MSYFITYMFTGLEHEKKMYKCLNEMKCEVCNVLHLVLLAKMKNIIPNKIYPTAGIWKTWYYKQFVFSARRWRSIVWSTSSGHTILIFNFVCFRNVCTIFVSNIFKNTVFVIKISVSFFIVYIFKIFTFVCTLWSLLQTSKMQCVAIAGHAVLFMRQ